MANRPHWSELDHNQTFIFNKFMLIWIYPRIFNIRNLKIISPTCPFFIFLFTVSFSLYLNFSLSNCLIILKTQVEQLKINILLILPNGPSFKIIKFRVSKWLRYKLFCSCVGHLVTSLEISTLTPLDIHKLIIDFSAHRVWFILERYLEYCKGL